MRERERERGRDIGRGRSRLHAPGARRGIRSRVSRIAPWATKAGAKPLRHPGIPNYIFFNELICQIKFGLNNSFSYYRVIHVMPMNFQPRIEKETLLHLAILGCPSLSPATMQGRSAGHVVVVGTSLLRSLVTYRIK